MEHACVPVLHACSLRCLACLQVCCYSYFIGVLAYSNLPTERSATTWFHHTIIPQTDSYRKNYCCADACHTPNTTPNWRKVQAATAISGRDTVHANRAAVANAFLHLLSEWCPLLLYLGHVVQECNWSGENNGTGSRDQEVLQLSLCLLRRLRQGPCATVLKYERTIMCTLLYNSKWHQDLPGQAHSEEFGEGMLSKLVRDKARNTGSVTIEEMENHYLLLKVGPGGKHVSVQNVPKNLVHRMRKRLTRFVPTDLICTAYVESESDRVSTVATSWPRRLPRFPPPPTQPFGYDQYRLLGQSVLDAVIDQKPNPTNQLKRKLDAVVGQRTDMDADRLEAGTRNVRQRLR